MLERLCFIILIFFVSEDAWSQENIKIDTFLTELNDGKAMCVSMTMNNGESNIVRCYFVDSKLLAKVYSTLCNRLNGPYLEYYQNGQIEKFYNFVWGFETGIFITYFKNGIVQSIGSYLCIDTIKDFSQKAAQIKDTSELFYSSTTSYTYYREKEGEWKYYYDSGKIEHREFYLRGKKEGEWTYYSPEGFVIRQELYINGLLIKK